MSDETAIDPEPAGEEREVVGPGKPPKAHQFKPGNPGRQKGSRNKLGEAFLEDLYSSWAAHGPETIEKVRTEKPDQYLKVVASILPRELNVKVSELDDLDDATLDRRIAMLAAAVGLAIGTGEGAGTEEASASAQPTGDVPAVH